MAKREITYGNSVYRKIYSRTTKYSYDATYWDLWISVSIKLFFNDSIENILSYFKTKENHINADLMVSQLIHFQLTLSYLEIDYHDILSDLNDEDFKKLKSKVKTKVIDMHFQPREHTDWMRDNPRSLRYRNAMHGNWGSFPVSPEKYIESFQSKFKKKSGYDYDQSFALAERLTKFLEKNKPKNNVDLLAYYRAFLTAIVDNFCAINDSHGQIGILINDYAEKYIAIDWRKIFIDPVNYFKDLIRFIIWEYHGITKQLQSVLFQNFTKNEIEKVALFLEQEYQYLRFDNLTNEASQCLTLLAELYAQNLIFDKFLPLAKRMGSKSAQRILTLSSTAEEHGKHHLALDILEVASKDQSRDQSFLRSEFRRKKKKLLSNR